MLFLFASVFVCGKLTNLSRWLRSSEAFESSLVTRCASTLTSRCDRLNFFSQLTLKCVFFQDWHQHTIDAVLALFWRLSAKCSKIFIWGLLKEIQILACHIPAFFTFSMSYFDIIIFNIFELLQEYSFLDFLQLFLLLWLLAFVDQLLIFSTVLLQILEELKGPKLNANQVLEIINNLATLNLWEAFSHSQI